MQLKLANAVVDFKKCFSFHCHYLIMDTAYKVTLKVWKNQKCSHTTWSFHTRIINQRFSTLFTLCYNLTTKHSNRILAANLALKKKFCILQQERPGCTSWVLAWGGQCLLKLSLGRTCKDSGPRSMRARATHRITTSPLRSAPEKHLPPKITSEKRF